ncbi:hypothetical protein [Novosphingobium sp. PhB165]|uniref:hypothetical protein n=1 Tax=Novosphingobium sp. PhB165 TaxID=2485105 RepID=UPI001FB22AD1|nr:hypothetical protein [Novosphingobium sp. PhB165]
MAQEPAAQAPLHTVQEGLNLNTFVQQGPVAAHVLLRSGSDPRVIVAFPAGNSGVGLWFEKVPQAAEWTMTGQPQPVSGTDAQGRTLHGVTFRAEIRASRLVVRQAVLSSIRVLRDYQALGTAPAEVLVPGQTQARTLLWARDRLDGAPGYKLSLTAEQGTVSDNTITAGPDGRIVFTVTALTGEQPLTPFTPETLLTDKAAADPAARAALQFLSYHEKFMAGSWRFNTYFGRDTLMSVRMLMPALQPEAVETGLRAVLERLSHDGNVAHEEDIGEFAVLDHMRAGQGKSDTPTFNYAMIDSSFMLAPVAQAWLLDDPRGKARAADFLAEQDQGRPLGQALMTNIRFVAQQAQAFAKDPRWNNLIALHPGMDVGQWRDSNDGLGGGRYPYDVNAILVPAALDAADALARAGLLDAFTKPEDKAMLAQLSQMAKVWREHAPVLFQQTVHPAAAQAAIARYAKQEAVPAAPALAAAQRPIRYHAIALDAQGKPVPIVNSDEGFALLYGRPTSDQLSIAAETIGNAFPAGLMTGAGMVVANPVFASPELQKTFSRNAYHGTVIWSWHQALAASGLARQIARTDLSPGVCRQLLAAQDSLWNAIAASRSVQSSELWSWNYEGGAYKVVPFGASGADVDESNAAQLWSTVFLAVQRPAPATGCGK